MAEENQKPIINLPAFSDDEIGVILLCDSAVRFSNQSGGYACDHPSEQGVFVPFNQPFVGDLLLNYFVKEHNGWCSRGISEKDAEWLDNLFVEYDYTKRLKVDRSRLKDCKEAWIYVDIYPLEGSRMFHNVPSSYSGKAVLVWENSD